MKTVAVVVLLQVCFTPLSADPAWGRGAQARSVKSPAGAQRRGVPGIKRLLVLGALVAPGLVASSSLPVHTAHGDAPPVGQYRRARTPGVSSDGYYRSPLAAGGELVDRIPGAPKRIAAALSTAVVAYYTGANVGTAVRRTVSRVGADALSFAFEVGGTCPSAYPRLHRALDPALGRLLPQLARPFRGLVETYPESTMSLLWRTPDVLGTAAGLVAAAGVERPTRRLLSSVGGLLNGPPVPRGRQ